MDNPIKKPEKRTWIEQGTVCNSDRGYVFILCSCMRQEILQVYSLS